MSCLKDAGVARVLLKAFPDLMDDLRKSTRTSLFRVPDCVQQCVCGHKGFRPIGKIAEHPPRFGREVPLLAVFLVQSPQFLALEIDLEPTASPDDDHCVDA
jgi:hypothetical protein